MTRREDHQHLDDQVRRAVEPDPMDVARLTAPGARQVMFDEIVSAAAADDGAARRPAVRRRLVLVAAAASVVAAGAGVGWAVTNRDTGPPAAGGALDDYVPSDQRFFASLRPAQGAALARQPASLEAALTGATATVTATVAGVRPGRTLGGLQFLEVDLHVSEVLRGALRPELNGVVRVEFPAAFKPDPVGPTIEAMRSSLPARPSVWLLRWQGEPSADRKPGAPADDPTADERLYRLVHVTCGVFAQGEDGVIAATAPGEAASGARQEAEQLRHLSDLVTRARA